MNALEVQDITKTYRRGPDRLEVLRGVSLSVAAGQMVALRGPSGSGKSTLLMIAGGLLRPDAGSVHVAGTDLARLSEGGRDRLRGSQIGFVFQDFRLLPYLDVTGNIAVPSLTGQVESGRIEELIERLGLSARKDHRLDQLSVGERQRVALARAMVRRPALILADEPTGNLDDANATAVQVALTAYARQGGAVLLATHDPRLSADHSWRFSDGRLCLETTA